MDFSLLSEQELDEFLSIARTRFLQKYIQTESTKVAQATKLFEYLQSRFQNFNYPLPVLDLIVASRYSGSDFEAPRYTTQQIANLTEADIEKLDQFLHFDASLFPLEINRIRLLRIFRYLGMIDHSLSEEQLELLITGPIWEKIQKELSIEDLKSLLVNQKFHRHNWSITIQDPDQILSKVDHLDHLTLNLVDRISKIGSAGALIEAIVQFKHESLRRLCKWGVPLDFYYVHSKNLLETPNWESLTILTPLIAAVYLGNGTAIRILVEFGANVNGFRMTGHDLGNTSLQNPLSYAVKHPFIWHEKLFVLNDTVVLNPNDSTMKIYRILKTEVGPIKIPKWNPPELVKEERLDQIGIIQLLLSLGADPNGQDFCPSPLMLSNYLPLTKLLVEAGADVNRICSDEYHPSSLKSALAVASFGKYVFARYLLNQGADPNLPGQTDEGSLLSFIKRFDFPKIVQLLEKYGAVE